MIASISNLVEIEIVKKKNEKQEKNLVKLSFYSLLFFLVEGLEGLEGWEGLWMDARDWGIHGMSPTWHFYFLH